jgi:hypothetical protein
MMADARSLFWPWCIVAAVGILSLFKWPRSFGYFEIEVVAGCGFCVGLPLLAALSFGNEFQFGTLASLLSQPIERSRIWREKSAVIVLAVLSAAIAYGFGAHRMGWGAGAITAAGLWLMVTLGSSAYWTLVARSAIGGLVLNGLQSMALVLGFAPLLNEFHPDEGLIRNRSELFLPLAIFAAAITVLMLYLGRRKLLRFQVTGTGSGSTAPATDWSLAPNPLRKLLRCTASGATVNLVRKELYRLWPLAPLTLTAFGILLAYVPLQFALAEGYAGPAAVAIFLLHGTLVAILAGTLSLGEERSSGLHTWNMTQPVSVHRQWAVKLVTALCATAVCSSAVFLVAILLFGSGFLGKATAMLEGNTGIFLLVLFPFLAFFAFWCSTAVKGTVRAAFWCFPSAAAVWVVYDFGMSTAMGNSVVEVVRTLTAAVHPFPFSSEFEVTAYGLMWRPLTGPLPALWVTVWLLPVAVIQSYRLFRSDIREGMKPLIRQTLFLAAAGFLVGFLQILPAAAQGTMHNTTVRALIEISRGVAAMQLAPSAVSEAGYTVSLATISKSVALSDRTRSWFATDTVVIRPKSAVVRDNGDELLKETRYMITAELHGGWKCTFADNLFVDRYGEGANRIPRGANRMFVCRSEHGRLGWLELIP